MKKIIMLLFASLCLTQTTFAAAPQLIDIQKRWAEVHYSYSGDAQQQAFEALLTEVEGWLVADPNNAEAWTWQGIIESTYAGAKGGLGALGLAKRARKSLERAIELDPSALDGSAYGSLGTLYYKVPGWPLGFGNDKKAEQLLKKALAINPNGIDPNYFYADYLFEQGLYAQAKVVAEHALKAAARPQRPLADAKRREEVQALLNKIEAQG